MSPSTSPPADARLSPSRVRLARQRRGMSKVALADALGVTTRVLQTYESQGAPRARTDALAAVLHVDPRFFTLPDRTAVDSDHGFFRARRRATAYQLGAARAAASIGIELYEWLAGRFQLPALVVPDLDGQAPAAAAAALRAHWGRGAEALPNLVQLAESWGVRVLSLPGDAETVDAFSLWYDGSTYVFLSTAKTAERSRFDLAHELGHLVMHSRGTGGPDLERDADAFAAELLMPSDDLLPRAGREPAVPQILRLRDHYRVSAFAVTRQLHELGRLSDWAYRQNCVHLAQRGFRSSEPGGIARERSRVFALAQQSLRAQGLEVSDVAKELGLEPLELHALTFGQFLVPVLGAGSAGDDSGRRLHLVR